MRIGKALWLLLWVGVAFAAVPDVAFAYVGPGAGLTAIGTFLALVAAVFLGVVGFLWYPIRRLFRGKGAKTVARSSAEERELQAEREPPR